MKLACFILVLIGVCFLSIAAGFGFGARYREVKSEVKACRSEEKFGQLKVMLLAYHHQHGAFPPTKYRASPNGPVHSWRVLLVPHTDRPFEERFAHYDFSKPWDSVDNARALQDMPLFDYFNQGHGFQIANYIAIGEGDEWPTKEPLQSYLVTEGKDRFLLAEWPGSNVNWMEPRY
jgi:hypothetical protein